jgi:DNA ligase (NAD+)
MTRDEILKMSADTLVEAIRYHNKRYWLDDSPEIEDPLYDFLVERLRLLRPDAPILHAIGPAGAYPEGEGADSYQYGEKAAHTSPMLSLDKAYDEATVAKWFEKFEGGAWASPKIDGLACSLRFGADGGLRLAVTRGDGVRGDIITENIKRVADVPAAIPGAGAEVEVRGEVYMPLSVFEGFKDQYANPRNLAAGGLKQKDPAQVAPYKLRFFAYDLLGDGAKVASETEKRDKLRAWGFQPVNATYVERVDALQAAYDSFLKTRFDLDFETDGVVFRADRLDEQQRLGSTAHHPRYAIAYKYQGEAGVSTLVDVEWSVARTHIISPVAVVEPVVLSGASVTRATLHNLAFLEALGLTIGAQVRMMRRGGVIPHVEGVVSAGSGPIALPTHCPECGSAAERRGDFLYCTGTACKAAQVGLLKHFITIIDCKGFGEKIIDQLYDEELVLSPADFYMLTADRMRGLERMGGVLAQKLVANVQARRVLPLATFLRALGIDSLGKVSAQWVADAFLSLSAVRAATEPQVAAIFGLGDLTAQGIVEGLRDRAHVIDDLLRFVEVSDVTPADAATAAAAATAPFFGKKFLFTGALDTMPRKQAEAQVVALGASVPGGVQKDLDYLILGDADLAKFQGGWRSAKLKKAEQYNAQGAHIAIIGEADFLRLLAAPPSPSEN